MSDKERRERLLQTYSAICEESFKGVPEISSEELLQVLTSNDEQRRASVVLVDCRSEAEQSVSMFPGAVAMIDVETNLDKYKDLELIPYCAIGRRSGNFTKRILERNPSMKIRNHKGGILDWSHVQGPLVDRITQNPIQRVHAGGAYHLKHLPTLKSLEILLPQA
jgi:rhodanese-related sulfurtransferase